ncbi:hypothetical protein E1B28_006924 [Marasmius oreades]|uniref:Uncharacterized protein n=1 Tax=Marasmius oreades TaxID=181124 RepID=A0A9P7S291_9AGAR|nr:uncharacterized protein E1B28_006924 [Marasmius oreades]KAG7093238.1 hypothetical protein E1B28_006924 [Marasmius oreades]
MSRLTLQDLLNPTPSTPSPSNQRQNLQVVDSTNSSPTSSSPDIPAHLDNSDRQLTHENLRLNRKTTLSKVYRHRLAAIVEYPETGSTADHAVGHVFELDPMCWYNPANDFAYSRGDPRGIDRNPSTVPLLVSSQTGQPVPCTVRHSTCQGVKVCPYYPKESIELATHSAASKDRLQESLQRERLQRLASSSPSKNTFTRTSAYLAALVRSGCRSIAHEPTQFNAMEEMVRVSRLERQLLVQRGRVTTEGQCDGRLEFTYLFDGTPVVKCEHHSVYNRDHFFDATIASSSLNLEYLEAVLCEDEDEIERIELDVEALGYGPRSECYYMTNASCQRVYCPQSHRSLENGHLEQPLMKDIECTVTFREYEPLEEYRTDCPFQLVVSRGSHTHPIPRLNKTPTLVRYELIELLRKLDADLPDLTPRSFLRHPTIIAYLQDRFPLLRSPTISDLHISLSNRSHLKVYIDAIKKERFPEGTGWKGLLHLKKQQDLLLDPSEHYIRIVREIPFETHNDDVEEVSEAAELGQTENTLKIVVCITTNGSRRLASASDIQSDIAFQRVLSFYEFELAALERDTNTTVTFCRIYLTRKNARAHCIALAAIDEILEKDIGRSLQFRHIHGTHVNDYGKGQFILNWVVDQDRGQALGIGLRLQEISQQHPGKYDLHEPAKRLIDLGPYDHLARFLSLCTVHWGRNIRAARVSEEVRNLMRSLVCINHSDWDGTLQAIRNLGGKAGADWLADKESLPFVFPAICWEKSYIPYDIWVSRAHSTNTAEAAHRDINREGVQCTLVGATKKAMQFDHLKLISLQAFEESGINETYNSKHCFENALKGVKKRSHARIKGLKNDDTKIHAHNRKLQECSQKLHAAETNTKEAHAALSTIHTQTQPTLYAKAYQKWEKSRSVEEKLRRIFDKQVEVGKGLIKRGTGKVNILLPEISK